MTLASRKPRSDAPGGNDSTVEERLKGFRIGIVSYSVEGSIAREMWIKIKACGRGKTMELGSVLKLGA